MVTLTAGDGNESVKTCMLHRDTVIDMLCSPGLQTFGECNKCVSDWTCRECEEIRYDDRRVERGLTCFVCTYEYRGGE